MQAYLDGYMLVGLMLAIGCCFVAVAFLANRALRPDRPSLAKRTGYECGVDPVGEGWAQSHVRYYVFVYLYVVFAVDALFLFPWATIFARAGFGAMTLVEMFVFLGFLAVGILYTWRKGVLSWA